MSQLENGNCQITTIILQRKGKTRLHQFNVPSTTTYLTVNVMQKKRAIYRSTVVVTEILVIADSIQSALSYNT